MDLIFGPVPSRRLGRSLGVNNIPNKICTYGCVYCQLGKTSNFQVERRAYYSPMEIYEEAKNKVEKIGSENIDYITFVPDGEPTLDINLGYEASLLRNLHVPLAIITNSSLINNSRVREEMMNFDLVSLKIDAVTEYVWKKVNNPDPALDLKTVMDGIIEFSKEFGGKIITETMMVSNVDYESEIERIASFLKIVGPSESYISIPIRPTPERWATPPPEEILNKAFQEFTGAVSKVEFLTGYEHGEFLSSGNFEKDLLAIASVHPIRDDSMQNFLERYGKDMGIIDRLITENKLIKVEFSGHSFYIRNFRERLTLVHQDSSLSL